MDYDGLLDVYYYFYSRSNHLNQRRMGFEGFRYRMGMVDERD